MNEFCVSPAHQAAVSVRAPGLAPIVASTAIPIFAELCELAHSGWLLLDEASRGLRSEAARLCVARMAHARRAFFDEARRELGRLGADATAHDPPDAAAAAESLRRARTCLKTRWHRGDDEAVAGDLYEFEMQSLRRLEALLERSVLAARHRALITQLRDTLAADCLVLEAIAAAAAAAAPTHFRGRDPLADSESHHEIHVRLRVG